MCGTLEILRVGRSSSTTGNATRPTKPIPRPRGASQIARSSCCRFELHGDIRTLWIIRLRLAALERRRALLGLFRIEEEDIATAVISGVTYPATARGRAKAVVKDRKRDVLHRRCPAVRAMSTFPERFQGWSQEDKIQWRCAYIRGRGGAIDTWLPCNAGASLRPSPTINTLASGVQHAETFHFVGRKPPAAVGTPSCRATFVTSRRYRRQNSRSSVRFRSVGAWQRLLRDAGCPRSGNAPRTSPSAESHVSSGCSIARDACDPGSASAAYNCGRRLCPRCRSQEPRARFPLPRGIGIVR